MSNLKTFGANVILYPARAGSTEGQYVFTLAPVYDPIILDSSLPTYELQLDTSPLFVSVNRKSYVSTSTGIFSLDDGDVAKGFTITLPGRLDGVATTWYFRARVSVNGQLVESWSANQQLTVPGNAAFAKGRALYTAIPGEKVYSKEAFSTVFYRLISALMQEKDQLDLEIDRSKQDIYLSQARENALETAFADAASLPKPDSLSEADFRHQLFTLWKAVTSYPGTWQALVDFITAMVGEPPLILQQNYPVGWILPYHYLPDPDFPAASPTILLYPRPTDGNQFSIYVFNSWGTAIDESVVTEWVYRLKPAHAEVTVVFPTQKHTASLFQTAADWAACSIVNGTVVGDAVHLTASPLTIVTPEIDGTASLNAWDFGRVDATLSGQTLTLQIRSHPAGGGWSSWETFVPGGHAPFTTPPDRFFQLQLVATSTNPALYQPIINSLELFYLRGS